MSIKGFPSQKKIAAIIDGYTDAQSRASQEYATVQPSKDDRNGLDVVSRFACTIVSDTMETGSTTRVIKATAHVAVKGDFIRVTQAGTNQYMEMAVISVPSANYMILSGELLATPANGDTFDIKRYATPDVDKTTGGLTTTPGPAQYVLNTVDTEVMQDTGTPANSKPLPVLLLSTIGVGVDPVTAAMAGGVTETAPATDTASSGLNGRLQRIAQRITSLIALIPASLGQKADASSFAVTISTEGTAQLGSLTETAPATDTASSGLNGRLQRVAQRITSLIALVPASLGSKAAASSFAITSSTEDVALQGSLTETAPGTDTASSGLNGRLQRIAQRLTSLIALLPASLGSKAAASSLAVTSSTEDAASMGSLTETAPATDTASSGHNGRLQRIAQRITSLIALVPASLGQKAMASAFAVSIASDQSAVATKSPVNASGSIVNTALSATTAGSSSAPANAVGFILQAPSDNTHNIRWGIGGTASTTTGMLLEPGRDTGFVPCAATVSVCAITSGTNAFAVQWILSA